MQFLIPLIIMAAMFFMRYYLHKKQQNPLDNNAAHWPFQTREKLLNPQEMDFLHALQQYLGSDFLFMTKVHLQSLVYTEAHLQNREMQAAFSGKYVDFVVCAASDSRIICAIELADEVADGRSEDDIANITKILNTAGIRLMHYQSKYEYSADDFVNISNLYKQMHN